MCQIPSGGEDGFGGQNTCDAWQSISAMGVRSHPRIFGLVVQEHVVTTIAVGLHDLPEVGVNRLRTFAEGNQAHRWGR